MLFRIITKTFRLLQIFAGLVFIPPSAAAALKIGAWVGGYGAYPQPTEQNVAAFEALQGRPLDLLSVFVLWDTNDWAWTRTFADVAENRGAKLVVTWMPNGYSAPKIVSGVADAYLRKYAQGVKAYGKEIWLRPLHEANWDWYDWGIAKAGRCLGRHDFHRRLQLGNRPVLVAMAGFRTGLRARVCGLGRDRQAALHPGVLQHRARRR